MILEITKTKTYIPEFNGNTKLAGADQIVVTYKAATIDIKDRLRGAVKNIGRYDKDGKYEGFEVTVDNTDEQLLNELLIGIKNAAYQSGDKVVEINSAKSLLTAPIEFDELKTEIIGVLRNEVYRKAVDEKN